MKGYFSFIIKLMYLLINQARLKMMCGSVNAASSRAEKLPLKQQVKKDK